jgi:DNA-binding GntR family transcriptional regulator
MRAALASPDSHEVGTLTDRAHAELRRQIVSLRLPPGARLTEYQVTQMLGMGKTPVREALARLVERRLVRSIPRVGYEVSPIALQDVQQICDLRLMVEPEAVRLAVPRLDVREMRRLDERCIAGYEAAGYEEFIEANHRFHIAIASASGNDRLAELLDHLMDESDRLYRVGLRLRGSQIDVHTHDDLMQTFEAGDAKAAMAVTARQIREFRRMVVEALMTTPSILSIGTSLSGS